MKQKTRYEIGFFKTKINFESILNQNDLHS